MGVRVAVGVDVSVPAGIAVGVAIQAIAGVESQGTIADKQPGRRARSYIPLTFRSYFYSIQVERAGPARHWQSFLKTRLSLSLLAAPQALCLTRHCVHIFAANTRKTPH